MTAQIIQIGNRFYRIYGEGNAEYLLLQMTDEHELQSMGSEVAAIAQDTSQFLFAAVPVMNWNDELSPWKSPAVWGKQGFGGNPMGTLRFLTEQVVPTLKLSSTSRKMSKSFRVATRWSDCLHFGYPPRQICSTVSPLHLHPYGFRDGWSLNNNTRFRRSTSI